MSIKFGCHGSTWELDYDKETDYLDQIIEAVSEAGFKGIDVQVALLGRYKNAPERLKEKLNTEGIDLVSLTLPFSWEGDKETIEERKRADHYIEYVKQFPNAILNVPPRIGSNRDNLFKRQNQIINCANALGKRAYESGVDVSFHPSSPSTSFFRTAEDYEILFEGLDTRYIGYTPDAGHIAAGGMDATKVIQENLPIIRHVHFKDFSNEWKKMGDGDIDFPAIVKSLTDYGYKGWIMVEEETEESKSRPNQAIFDANDYVQKNLKQLLKE